MKKAVQIQKVNKAEDADLGMVATVLSRQSSSINMRTSQGFIHTRTGSVNFGS